MLVLFETRSYLKFILLYSEAYTVYVHYIDEEFLNLNSYKSPYVKKEQFYSTFLSFLFYCNFNQFYLIAKMSVQNQTWFCWEKRLHWKKILNGYLFSLLLRVIKWSRMDREKSLSCWVRVKQSVDYFRFSIAICNS